jgi:hypothetical protein
MTEAPLIIRGGQAIMPKEVERILLAHPGVAEAAVVGIPDRFWDEAVAAAVTLSVPLPSAVAELAAYCRRRLAAFKVPTRWLLCDALPRTPAGEVCRTTLTARLAGVSGPGGAGFDGAVLDDAGFYGTGIDSTGFDSAGELEEVAGLKDISWFDGTRFARAGGMDGSPWIRPATPGLRVPRQVRRSRALEDLDYL